MLQHRNIIFVVVHKIWMAWEAWEVGGALDRMERERGGGGQSVFEHTA